MNSLVPPSSYAPSVHSSSSVSASTALTAALSTSNSRPPCSYHLLATGATRRRSASIHRSNIVWVIKYWTMVLWWWTTCMSTSSRPVANIASASGVYYQCPLHCFVVTYLPTGGPPCGGDPPEFDQYRGSLPVSPIWKKVFPERSLCITYRRSRCIPPPGTIYCTPDPTLVGPSENSILLPASHNLTWSIPSQVI